MKKIVVTGAAGFLGGRTSKHLAQIFPNSTILATSRRDLRREELKNAGCDFVAGDLADPNFCSNILSGADSVIHCAALSSPWGAYSDFYLNNVVATQNLVFSAQNAGVSTFIQISTPSIYATSSSRFNISEDDPLPPKMINFYATTKLEAEKIVLNANSEEFKTLALRPRGIIGAEDTVIFPRLMRAYEEGKLSIVGDGKNMSDFTCVRNLIEAIVLSLNAKNSAFGQAYNITDGQPLKFWDVIRYTFEKLEKPIDLKKIPKSFAITVASAMELWARLNPSKPEPILTKYSVGVLSNSLTLDISKAKEKLNYAPSMTTHEGIDEFINWYKK